MDHFEIIKKLGKGAFASVWCVKPATKFVTAAQNKMLIGGSDSDERRVVTENNDHLMAMKIYYSAYNYKKSFDREWDALRKIECLREINPEMSENINKFFSAWLLEEAKIKVPETGDLAKKKVRLRLKKYTEELAQTIIGGDESGDEYKKIKVGKHSKICIPALVLQFDVCDFSLCTLFDEGSIPIKIVKEILRQTLVGLNWLHKNNLVHCDIKPNNILIKFVDDDEQIRKNIFADIGDYILNRPFRIEIIDYNFCVDSGTNFRKEIGTMHYVPPEFLLPSAINTPINYSFDIWSFMCLAAEMFIGSPIFDITLDFPVTYGQEFDKLIYEIEESFNDFTNGSSGDYNVTENDEAEKNNVDSSYDDKHEKQNYTSDSSESDKEMKEDDSISRYDSENDSENNSSNSYDFTDSSSSCCDSFDQCNIAIHFAMIIALIGLPTDPLWGDIVAHCGYSISMIEENNIEPIYIEKFLKMNLQRTNDSSDNTNKDAYDPIFDFDARELKLFINFLKRGFKYTASARLRAEQLLMHKFLDQ